MSFKLYTAPLGITQNIKLIDDEQTVNQTSEATMEIAVLWPLAQTAQVEEIDFSHGYCKRTTQTFLKHSHAVDWHEYSDSNFHQQFRKTSKASLLLLITDPNLVITDGCLNQLLKSCRSTDRPVIPTYNFSPQPEQQAALDFEYDTVSTFLELAISDQLAGADSGAKHIEHPDNGCILVPARYIQSLTPSKPDDIFQAIRNDIRLSENAIVHRFAHYADMPRPELVELVHDKVKSVLDIGCGTGQYGKSLSQLRPDISIIGIERSAKLAKQAACFYSEVINKDIEQIEADFKVDLINCGDILEHLRDPWQTLIKLADILSDEGYLTVSIPNASHWSIVRELVSGKFDYLPAGLFCIGHIRWFTEHSFSGILDQCGFTTEKIIRLQPTPSPQGEALIQSLKEISGYDETALRTHTLLFRAVKKSLSTNPLP
ncbi:MAG: class I SAM-dependent methyltransferase [Candidatus Thiodiazotropha sp.]